MHDVQSVNVILESGKTCRDYITDYMTTVKEQRISQMAEAFGLDKELLHTMMTLHITEQNIDEFGRFSQLQNSIDVDKAQAYFLAKTGKEIDIFDAMWLTGRPRLCRVEGACRRQVPQLRNAGNGRKVERSAAK